MVKKKKKKDRKRERKKEKKRERKEKKTIKDMYSKRVISYLMNTCTLFYMSYNYYYVNCVTFEHNFYKV